MANTSVSTSVAILSRLSAANIDPFTLAVGHVLSAGFKLSIIGQKRLHEALSKLVSCSSIGNMIWSAIAAMILSELAELHGAPEDLRPSLQQWLHLIRSCSGVLAGTNFSCVAERFMSLAGSRITVPRSRSLSGLRVAGNLKDIAKALKAMSLVSIGSLTSITIQGGLIYGWIAALGHGFLGLEVRIQSSDGIVLFSSPLYDSDMHLSIVYSSTDTSNVSVVSNSYFIRQTEDIFDHSGFNCIGLLLDVFNGIWRSQRRLGKMESN